MPALPAQTNFRAFLLSTADQSRQKYDAQKAAPK